ncbi:hypothetical protein JTB14_021613 [Gonioctena quinquepunctata]|nr:hypothetical protein JTB14_021613 [Gonioctena quinquepunctata]
MGRENYCDWACAVENVFVLEGLLKCIDGSEEDAVLCEGTLVKSDFDLCKVCCEGKQARQSFSHKAYEPQESGDSVGAEAEAEVDQSDDTFHDISIDHKSENSTSDEEFLIELPQAQEDTEVRKSQRTIKPKQFEDYVTYTCLQYFNSNDDPVTVSEAMSRADAELWRKVMSEEV